MPHCPNEIANFLGQELNLVLFFFSLVLYRTQKMFQFFFFNPKGQMSKMKFKTERARKPAAGQSRRQIEDVSDLTGPGAPG